MVGSVLFHLACSGAIHKATLRTYLKEKRNGRESKSILVSIGEQPITNNSCSIQAPITLTSSHTPRELPGAPEGCLLSYQVLQPHVSLFLEGLLFKMKKEWESSSLPPFNTQADILPKNISYRCKKYSLLLKDLHRFLCCHFFSLVRRQKVMPKLVPRLGANPVISLSVPNLFCVTLRIIAIKLAN